MDGRVFVFVGPTGSGKSELAMNFAEDCAAKLQPGQRVHLIDMDQTKAMFRTRDFQESLVQKSICLNRTQDETDTHAVAEGVRGALMDTDAYCVIDAGGNEAGAIMLGQFAEHLNAPDARVFYVINPMRPFSDKVEDIQEDIEKICRAAGLEHVTLLCNPCMGGETTPALIAQEYKALQERLRQLGRQCDMLVAAQENCGSELDVLGIPVYPLRLHIQY